MSPLKIRLALARYCSPNIEQFFAANEFGSHAFLDAKAELDYNGLIREDGHASPKLKAYVEALMAVPLPVCKWVIPEGEE